VSTVVSQPDSSGTFNGLAWGADGNLYADAAVVGGYKVYEINPSLGTQTPVFSSSLVLGNLAAGVSCLWATAGSQVVPLNYVGSGSCTASTLTDPYGQASSVVQAGQYLYVSTYEK
jgi:hypothetical protein